MLRGELLDEQDRRSHVLVEERVQLFRRHVGQPPVPAAGMVDDQQVDVAERRTRFPDNGTRRVGVGEVGFGVSHAVTERADRISRFAVRAPLLCCVVRRPAVCEDVGALGGEPPRNREADAAASARTCHQRHTSVELSHGDSIPDR